jgi:hypothetical protein
MSSSDHSIHPFFRGAGPHGNVVFNFRGAAPDDLPAYAEGYHMAGRALVEKLAAAHGYADYEGYPILFLYRHALELNMKALIYRGSKYLGLMTDRNIDAEKFFGSHDLPRFLPPLREIFDHMGWHGDLNLPGLKTWEDFCGIVRAIDELDHGSYSFRYPMNTHGESPLSHHTVLNVIAFGRNMDALLDALNAAAEGIEERWDTAAEACYFLQEIAKEWRKDHPEE